MTKGDVYRRCASIMVFRHTEDGKYEFLLLHKPRKRDDWQLPQGGCEGSETTEQAALRELQEEAGITAEIFGKSANQYKYDFPTSYRRFRPDNVCGQCIQFVFATLKKGEEVQVDQDEIDDYKWICIEDLDRYIKRDVYRKLVSTMFEEGIKFLA